jgi:Methyltransferase FkbM domain
VVRLDDLELAPAFIKIDVQGLELAVLKGLRRTIARHRPVILVEVNGSEEMVAHMVSLGYAPHVYDGKALRRHAGESVVNLFMLPSEQAS